MYVAWVIVSALILGWSTFGDFILFNVSRYGIGLYWCYIFSTVPMVWLMFYIHRILYGKSIIFSAQILPKLAVTGMAIIPLSMVWLATVERGILLTGLACSFFLFTKILAWLYWYRKLCPAVKNQLQA